MPTVHVRITEGASRAEKAQLVQDMTATLVKTLGKEPDTIHVTIEEIPEENWGYAGMLTDEYRAQKNRNQS